MDYTTIEQSKKLLELGLNTNTADMHYLDFCKEDFRCITAPYRDTEFTEVRFWTFPCWSLGALMELMPKICEDENDRGCYPTLCKGFDTDMWHCVYRNTLHITDWYKSPIDAAFEMVMWLLENGYIKTEKKRHKKKKELNKGEPK